MFREYAGSFNVRAASETLRVAVPWRKVSPRSVAARNLSCSSRLHRSIRRGSECAVAEAALLFGNLQRSRRRSRQRFSRATGSQEGTPPRGPTAGDTVCPRRIRIELQTSAVASRARAPNDHPQFHGLGKLLHSLKGMVIVSSYPGPLYHRLYRTWHKISWTGGQYCSQNTGGKTRTECVWLNPAAYKNLPQSRLPFAE